MPSLSRYSSGATNHRMQARTARGFSSGTGSSSTFDHLSLFQVMRIIKLGFISIIVFAIVLFLLSLLIPSHIIVSRAINIQADNIEGTIGDLRSWPQWNEIYHDSAKVTIVSATPTLVETMWTYKNKQTQGNFRIEKGAGVSVVQWYFDFKLKWYPWQKFSSIVFDKEFGPPMERSLNNLKKRLESAP